MRRAGLTGLVFGGATPAVLGAVRAAVASEAHAAPGVHHASPFPFVTISRQAGAGGRTLAAKLAERLNEIDLATPGEPAWAAWDHELVEKVSREHGIDESVVASLESARRPWLADLLAGLSPRADATYPDEFRVYKRVATTIRGLAKVGRAIIVGRGSVFITRDLPSGVHVRLVAPHAFRVRHMAALRDLSESDAAALVDRIDRERLAFFHQHWASASLEPETFTMTLNTAGLGDDAMADCVLPLVRARMPAPQRSRIV